MKILLFFIISLTGFLTEGIDMDVGKVFPSDTLQKPADTSLPQTTADVKESTTVELPVKANTTNSTATASESVQSFVPTTALPNVTTPASIGVPPKVEATNAPKVDSEPETDAPPQIYYTDALDMHPEVLDVRVDTSAGSNVDSKEDKSAKVDPTKLDHFASLKNKEGAFKANATLPNAGDIVAAEEGGNRQCYTPLRADLIFIMDAESDILDAEFKKEKTIIKEIVSDYRLHGDYVRVSVIKYNGAAFKQIHYNDYQEQDDFNEALDKTPLSPFEGEKRLDSAIDFTKYEMLFEKQRPGYSENKYRKIVFMFSDGFLKMADRDVADGYKRILNDVQLMKSHKIEFFVFAVGADRNTVFLKTLATSEKTFYEAESFSGIHDKHSPAIIKEINQELSQECKEYGDMKTAVVLPHRQLPQLGTPSGDGRLCKTKIDVAFILDSSDSLRAEYQKEKDFLKGLAHTYGLDEEQVYAGVVTFSWLSEISLKMGQYRNKESFDAAVDAIPMMGYTTRIDRALRMTQRELLVDGGGARPKVPKMVVLLTDGSQTPEQDAEEPDMIADELRAQGVQVVVVGVGKSIVQTELLAIAGDVGNLFIVRSFDELMHSDLVSRIPMQACPRPIAIWGPWEGGEASSSAACSESCGQGVSEQRRNCVGGEPGEGECTGEQVQNVACNLGPCPAEWSEWVESGPCSATCGPDAERMRIRECLGGGNAVDGGCLGDETEVVSCNLPACPSQWGAWVDSDACTATCGADAMRTRVRECIGGKAEEGGCQGDAIEIVNCNLPSCPTLVAAPPAAQGKLICKSQIDLGFILDASNSVRGDFFEMEKDFIKQIAGAFSFAEDQARAGLITFSYNAETSVRMNEFQTLDSFSEAVDKIELHGYTTRIDRALRLTQKEMFTAGNGDRAGVPDLLILLTDGTQTADADAEPPAKIADELRASGVSVVVVGVGQSISKAELLAIAHGEENLFIADSFAELMSSSFMKEIPVQVCEKLEELKKTAKWAPWSEWGGCNVACGSGTMERKRFCEGGSLGDGECQDSDTESKPCNLKECFVSTKSKCQAKVDVGFIMDSSNSLRNEYQKETFFLKTMAREFGIGPDAARVGVITFSTYTEHSIRLNQYEDIASFSTAVDNIEFMGYTTRIDRALDLAQRELFESENGGREGVPKVIILMTDGTQTQDPGSKDPGVIADALRAKGIDIVVVGIGRGITEGELERIAGARKNLFLAQSFDNLLTSNFFTDIPYEHCSIPKWGVWVESKCSADCGDGAMERKRACFGGNPGDGECQGPDTEVISCNIRPCAFWSPWKSEQCSVTCSAGVMVQTRICQDGVPGQDDCQGPTKQTVTCSMPPCVNSECKPICHLGPKGRRGTPGKFGGPGPQGLTGDPGIPGLNGEKGLVGGEGISGPRGTRGDKGLRGSLGFPGYNGIPGFQGISGRKGPDGKCGKNGKAGDQGFDAPDGKSGPRGRTGRSGSKGERGIPGKILGPSPALPGALGDLGEDGIAGREGRAGMDGPPGVNGPQGDGGLDAYNGEPGEQGDPTPVVKIKGEKGTLGDQGGKGPPGEDFVQKTIVERREPKRGDRGDKGFEGQKGFKGLTPTRPGPQGPQGLPGDNGFLGDKGIVGPDGLKGESGDDGFPGIYGRQGSRGVKGFNGFPGTKGENGLPGQGGARGKPGRTPLFAPKGVAGVAGVPGKDGVPGRAGVPGKTGDQGATGYPGLLTPGEQGNPGFRGYPGRKGEIGAPGKSGRAGFMGPDGIDGSDGPSGDRGHAGEGLAGETGFPGKRGVPGPRGPRGSNGRPGRSGRPFYCGLPCIIKNGLKGNPGPAGNGGYPGFPGRVGLRGLQGDVHQCPLCASGPQGITGTTGRPGMPGKSGEVGEKGAVGDAGYPGSPGLKGKRGKAGFIGFDGPKGERGQSGPDGAPARRKTGLVGESGDAGPDGEQGPIGSTGIRGAPGLAGSAGDPGLRGRSGAKGTMGKMGTRGPDATNGNPGPVGDAGDSVQGYDGAAGDAGVAGPQGVVGPRGAEGQKGPIGTAGAQACGAQKFDVGFILDSSGSLRNNYQDEKNFLKKLAETYGIGPGQSQGAVVTFSYFVEHSIKLKDHNDLNTFNRAVDNIALMGHTTRIDKALIMAQREVFTEANGARRGVPKVLILLTDGSQTQDRDAVDPGLIAQQIRSSGVKLMAIGIGRKVNRTELLHLAGDKEENLYLARSFSELVSSDFLTKIKSGQCARVPDGDVGPVGSPGLSGPTGQRGSAGPAGRPGSKGIVGDEGMPAVGPSGPIGEQGSDGSDAAPGTDGFPGIFGQPGRQGADGKDGTPGRPAAKAKQGPAGFPGPDGKPGLSACASGGSPASQLSGDVIFLLDTDQALSSAELAAQRQFVKMLLGKSAADGDLGTKLRIGVVKYNGYASTEFGTRQFSTAQQILAGIDRVDKSPFGGEKRVDTAIEEAEYEFQKVPKDSRKIVVIMSEGRIQSSSVKVARAYNIASQSAKRMKASGVTVISIGVGSRPNSRFLKNLASVSSDYLEATSYSALQSLQSTVHNLLSGTVEGECQGQPGEPGQNGAPGLPGTSGKPGSDGRPGKAGSPGADGKQGATGPVGPDGLSYKGPRGEPGLPGKAGPAATSDCLKEKFDVGFILDSSGSLRNEYQTEKDFLKKLASNFDISQEGSRAGVLTFSYYVEHSIKMKDHSSVKTFNTAVDNIALMGHTTRIDKALRMAQTELFAPQNGARLGAEKVLFLLTDGSQTPDLDAVDPGTIANEIRRQMNVRIMVVGIGQRVNRTELLHLAGEDPKNLFLAQSFDELVSNTFVQRIQMSSQKLKSGSCGPKDGLPGRDVTGPDGQKGEKGEAAGYGVGIVGPLGERGDPGNPGTPGTPGTPGQAGERGNDGFDGLHGTPGSPGTPGKDGMMGQPGRSACQVSVGPLAGSVGDCTAPKGQPGDNGLSGEDGDVGAPGANGESKVAVGRRGSAGEAGPDGRSGAEGPPGDDGLPGRNGLAGRMGKNGAKGESGNAGYIGERGDDGEPGSPGLPGNDGKDSKKLGRAGVPGRSGRAGPAGPKGGNGYPGFQGPTGPKGNQGYPGRRGRDGSDADPGADGRPGRPGKKGQLGFGAVGRPGRDGRTGQKGTEGRDGVLRGEAITAPGRTGLAGPKGEPGLPGEDGPRGRQGYDGFNGRVGASGLPGANGTNGRPGYQGYDGLIGLKGEPGYTGRIGIKGKPGRDSRRSGLPGPAGMVGDIGPMGFSGLYGLKGSRGEQGLRGVTNAPYANPPGAKGRNGNAGYPGRQGEPGEPGYEVAGLRGLPGTKGKAGPPGPVGTHGFVGLPGAKGSIGKSGFVGRWGDDGNPGAQGRDGPVGPPGVFEGKPAEKGSAGANGAAGLPGVPGLPGRRGPIGKTGFIGLSGEPGMKGADGFRGLQGGAGRPGGVGPRGPSGFVGKPGSQGATGRPGANTAASGHYIVRHSQDNRTPGCPRGARQLWTGYSLMYTVGNGHSHGQDLGNAGSCIKSFSSLPFLFCSLASGTCKYSQRNDYSYWLAGEVDQDGMRPVSNQAIDPFISRCVVCEATMQPLAVHSQDARPARCPRNFDQVWSGFSFLMVAGKGKTGAGQDLSSSGSCLEKFRHAPFIECQGGRGTCSFFADKFSFWLARIEVQDQFQIPRSRQFNIKRGDDIRRQISRCSVCMRRVRDY